MKLSVPGKEGTKGYEGSNYLTSLDTGTSRILLPNGMASKICADLNGTALPNSGGSCTADCSLRRKAGGLTFELEGKDILVTYDNLISEQRNGGSSICIVDVADIGTISEMPAYILGGK
jgi:hypothetical protein